MITRIIYRDIPAYSVKEQFNDVLCNQPTLLSICVFFRVFFFLILILLPWKHLADFFFYKHLLTLTINNTSGISDPMIYFVGGNLIIL